MLKKETPKEEMPIISNTYDKLRDTIITEFNHSSVFKKQKLTQGLYWTDFDKDIANQYVREESWFLGIKISDILKLIDHSSGVTNSKKDKIGF